MTVRFIVPDISDKNETQVDYVYPTRLFCAKTPGKTNRERAATGRKLPMMPLALPTLAALTPSDVDVKIIDENIERIDFSQQVDIVGISFMSFACERAFQIADEFRRNGVYVALGGVHVTALPDESALHADTIFIGEAEDTWPAFIEDFKNKSPKKRYVCEVKPDLKKRVIPRWDLVESKYYLTPLVQVARGCNNNCDFCSVRALFGRTRYKPIDNVIAEIEAATRINRTPGLKQVSFADDNITADRAYAKELFQALIPLNIRWSSQADINIASDDELLCLAKKSGCDALYIGFESLDQDNLNALNKGGLNKRQGFEEAIEKIHSHGIHIYAFILFGLDSDESTVFENTVEFISKTGISFPIISLLAPAPKTRLAARMEKEGRILSREWKRYDGSNVLIEPKNLSQTELLNGFRWSLKRLYSSPAIFDRMHTLWNRGLLRSDKNHTLIKLFLISLLTKEIFRHQGKTKDFLKKMRRTIWKYKGLSLDFIIFSLSFFMYAHRLPEPEFEPTRAESRQPAQK